MSKIFGFLYKKNLSYKPSLIKECSKDLLCIPFWDAYTKLLSAKIYLPDVNNTYQHSNIDKTLDNSWFIANEFVNNDKAYELKFKRHEHKEQTLTKTRKVNIYLTNPQRKYMRQIVGTYRYFYNRCVTFFNNYDKKTRISKYYINPTNKLSMIIVKVPEKINPYNFISMRSILKCNKPSWLLKDFPEHLIDQALKEAFTRFGICLTQCIETGKLFEFKYKNGKLPIQSINLEKEMIHRSNSLFMNWKIDDKYMFRNLKTSEKFSKFKFKGSSITYHKILNKFTLNLNYVYQTQKYNNSNRIGAIDPGQRVFATIFSTDKIIEIGNDACEKLFKICREIDIIQSRLNRKEYYIKVNHNRRRNLKRALHNKIKYIKSLRNELHNKCIKYICNNYSTIILPPYEIQNMVGKLHSKIARGMYSLAYYLFREKLIKKAKEYSIYVLIKPEYYTTKTCGRCGHLNHEIGNKKVFKCPSCNLEILRDHNAGRNILLRNIRFA